MKQAKKVLIVHYPDGYRGCDAGKIYTLRDNFEQDMNLLLVQGAWYTLDERCFKDFMDSFWNNKVKIGVVGKNTTDLSNFKTGDIMTGKGFDKDTMCDNFQICGPNCYSYYKTHAPITDVVDLTDEQKEIIEKIIGTKKDLIGVDKFINAFYLLLLLQNHRLKIKPISMTNFDNKTKGRDGYTISINKPNYYSYKERETREQELRENIRNAQKAIRYLTGYELEFDGKAELDEAIIVNREIDNGLIKAVKTGDKRIGLNDALELSRVGVGTDMAYVFGKVFKNHAGITVNYGIAYSLLHNLFEVVDHDGVMFVEKDVRESVNLGECVDCCITIDNDVSIGRTYLFWGKDATALELCGGIERYAEMIENQINKGGNND